MNKLICTFFLLIISGCVNMPNSKEGSSNECNVRNSENQSDKRYCEAIIRNKKSFDNFRNDIKKVQDHKSYDQDKFIAYADGGCVVQRGDICPFKSESDYLRGEWPPKIGLALSGGGTRSASFNIGVLKALHELGILEEVNVISSVSGGSYAAYWYFSQHFYMDKVKRYIPVAEYNENDIFATSLDSGETNLTDPDKYRFQIALEERSNILSFTYDPSWWSKIQVGLQYSVETTIQAITIPVHWVKGGLFDWEINMMPYFYYYLDGIDRTYGFVPLDYSLQNFANARPVSKFFENINASLVPRILENIDAEPIFLNDMRSFLSKKKNISQKFPYFIINTTGRHGAEFNKARDKIPRTMENTVFEFTPWGCHSTLLSTNDVHECPKIFRISSPKRGINDLDLARIVTISGAAIDGQYENVDIAGYGRKSSGFMNQSWQDILLNFTNMNMGYYLTNPRSSALRQIIHKFLPWPIYMIDDYISDVATSIYLTDGGHSDNLAVYSLIRRGVKHIYISDAEQDGNSIFEAAKRLKRTLEKYDLELSFDQKKKPLQVLFSDNNSVFKATVTDKNITRNLPKIDITYIKLSILGKNNHASSTENGEIPYTVKSYMEENQEFPHQSTTDIFYSPEQFKAYRDLGYMLTKSICKSFSDTPGCQKTED